MSSAPQPPVKKSHRGLLIITCVLIFMCGTCGLVAALVGNMASDDSATSSGDSGSGESTAGLNTAVRDGKFEFVVTAVECGQTTVGGAYLSKTAQGQYCVVTMTVENIGDEAQIFFDTNQKGYSADGAEYSTDSTATLYLGGEDSVWLTEINPGNSVEGQIAFDMPSDTTLTSLELHDSAFSGGVTVVVS